VSLLAPQLFVGSEPKREAFRPVQNDHSSFGVKPTGGMWTSTFEPATGSGWIEWCHAEDFRVPGAGWRSWLVMPESTLRTLVIDTLEDLRLALDRYARHDLDAAFAAVETFLGMGRFLDFEKLARDYDAIHLTEAGQWQTRLSHPDSLYGWDCESTLWLHWRVDRVQSLGRRTWLPEQPRPRRIRTARRDL
jgi:hypothetical protein